MQSFDAECRKIDSASGRSKHDIVTVNEVNKAHAEANQFSALLQKAHSSLSTIVDRKAALLGKLKNDQRIKSIRQLGDDTVTRTGMVVITMFSASGFVFVLCHLLGLRLVFWMIPLPFAVSFFGFLGTKLFRPDDLTLVVEIESSKRELQLLQIKEEETQAEIAKANAVCSASHNKYQSLLNQFNSCLNFLRSTNWEFLQGVPFEQFLGLIFVERGYEVAATKVTGDQGVDLIVSKNNVKWAIQAKGYPSSTVGNSAVQEAHTGMRFYGCQRCAVVTNSTFTSAARKLAEGVGCTLIDRDTIPLLIDGKINL